MSSYPNTDVFIPAHLQESRSTPLKRTFAVLTVCTAQHEGTFQSGEAVRENTVCYNTCSSAWHSESLSSNNTGRWTTSRASVEKKVKQMTSDIRRASKKSCLSSSGESRVVYSSFGPTAVRVIKGMAWFVWLIDNLNSHLMFCLTTPEASPFCRLGFNGWTAPILRSLSVPVSHQVLSAFDTSVELFPPVGFPYCYFWEISDLQHNLRLFSFSLTVIKPPCTPNHLSVWY